MANPLLPKPSLSATGSYFIGLGFRAFGGLGAVLALLTRELVERRAWLREADLTKALTYTKLLPGSTVVQVVAYLGHATGTTPRLEFLSVQAGDVEPTYADIRKARDLLGYAPRTPLAAGRQRFLRWLKADGGAPHA